MAGFVGRRRELARLDGMLAEVRDLAGSARPGRCVIIRGRRRIGKSALVEEFIEQQQVPSVFYTAEIGFGGEPLREFSEAVRISGLRDAQVFGEAVPGNWAAALRQLTGVLPVDGPSIVVLDELPYLMDPDGAFESVLQRSWDRELSRKPVLLILVGSDLSMMEALTSYGRPFHQRGTQLKVGPLNPGDVAAMAGLPAAEAFDAALVTGGLPMICARWRHGEDTRSFLARELANPVSPLVVSAQLSLAAEFPDQAQARSGAGAQSVGLPRIPPANGLLLAPRLGRGPASRGRLRHSRSLPDCASGPPRSHGDHDLGVVRVRSGDIQEIIPVADPAGHHHVHLIPASNDRLRTGKADRRLDTAVDVDIDCVVSVPGGIERAESGQIH